MKNDKLINCAGCGVMTDGKFIIRNKPFCKRCYDEIKGFNW
jgi:hypothetical protein